MSTVTFTIGGMSCAACVSKIEKALLQSPAIISAKVALLSETAEVQVDAGGLADALSRKKNGGKKKSGGKGAQTVDASAGAAPVKRGKKGAASDVGADAEAEAPFDAEAAELLLRSLVEGAGHTMDNYAASSSERKMYVRAREKENGWGKATHAASHGGQ